MDTWPSKQAGRQPWRCLPLLSLESFSQNLGGHNENGGGYSQALRFILQHKDCVNTKDDGWDRLRSVFVRFILCTTVSCSLLLAFCAFCSNSTKGSCVQYVSSMFMCLLHDRMAITRVPQLAQRRTDEPYFKIGTGNLALDSLSSGSQAKWVSEWVSEWASLTVGWVEPQGCALFGKAVWRERLLTVSSRTVWKVSVKGKGFLPSPPELFGKSVWR